jgi:exosortase D (VPLPA-CTERM-specific)
MAEGFLHAFEGWVVFMVCVGILLTEMWLMTFLGSDRRPFSEVFGLELPASTDKKNQVYQVRPVAKPYLLAAGMIAVTAVASASGFITERAESTPPRANFATFPMAIDQWHGETALLEKDVLDVLRLSDYVLANYQRGTEAPINFYAAYYASQRKGTAPHSPAVCMPGGGWQITELTQRSLPGTAIPGGAFNYNRVIIRNGEDAQLVYYWYQERGRRIASEYWAKWYLFQDALLKNRSDGALVRLVTPLLAGEPEEAADQRLTEFVAAVAPLLPQYAPN